MKRILFLASLLVAAIVQAEPSLQLTSAPSSVQSGASYYIEAACWDNMGGIYVTIYKNNSYFASASGVSPVVYCGGSTSDTGAQTVNFQIDAVNDYNQTDATSHSVTVNLISASFSLGSTSFTYNGSSQGPSVVPSPSGATYSTGGTLSATNAGSYTATATANGNYSGSNSSLGWSISPASASFSLSSTSFTYNGSSQGPSVVPSPSGATYSTGGTLSATNANSYTASATANGNYTGSNSSLGWSIYPMGPSSFGLSAYSFTYNGSSQGPTVIASPSGTTFTTGGTLYATNVGSYTATATATGNYSGSNSSLGWSIIPAPASFSLNQTTFEYNGSSQGPSVVPSPSGATYSTGGTLSATNVGSYTASATANGNYSGSDSLGWSISPASASFSLNQTSFAYNGSAQGPSVVPSPGGATYSTGGTLSATSVGSYTASATAYGNYTGSNSSLGWSIGLGSQTITFSQPAAQTYGGQLSPSATASSGLPVTFTLLSGPATLSFGTLTFTGAGSVVVRASQAGNGNYYAAADVDRTITVNKANQTVTFDQPAAQTYGGTPLGLSATASSGLAVTYAIVSGPATVSDNIVTFTGAGSVVVRASQAGNANYNTAYLDRTITVNQAGQTITFDQPVAQTYGTPLGLGATASSGLTVAYAIVSGPATVSGNTVTFTDDGSVVVRASQAGNANYSAATNVDRTLTVNQADPTGTFANRGLVAQTPTTYTVQAGDLNAVFSGPSGAATPTGTVTYAIAPDSPTGTPGTAVAAGNVFSVATYRIRASYPGDGKYHAAVKDATWIIVTDADADGLPGYIEDQLGTDPAANNHQTDTNNVRNELKIHQPTK